MSSAGANQESVGGTMKNVIDNPETKPQSHAYAENQSHSDTHHEKNKCATSANQESEGGTMKNVIDNPETKPQSHSDTHGNNKCSSGGGDHKSGENSCDNCHKK